jgi:UPF0755 protein
LRFLAGFFRLVLVLVLLASASAGVLGWYVYTQFREPGPAAREGASSVFMLEKGMGLAQTSQGLERDWLVRDGLVFRLGVMWEGKTSALKAGEYEIPSAASPKEIMDIFVSGKSIVHKLTVAEGLTTAVALDLVRRDPVLVGDVTLNPAEGALLPETYLFQRGTTRDQIVTQMMHAHTKIIDELWDKRQQGLPFETKNEAVTLASIVEKETGVPQERPHVAAVFINRLRKGMRLQSDPTIIYGLTKGVPLGRGIRQSELERATPYNTYVITGLPPTPIANPGRASIEAVLNPMATEDLYFVANGTGGHAFAATETEHNANVVRWRQIEREHAPPGTAAPAPTPAATHASAPPKPTRKPR